MNQEVKKLLTYLAAVLAVANIFILSFLVVRSNQDQQQFKQQLALQGKELSLLEERQRDATANTSLILNRVDCIGSFFSQSAAERASVAIVNFDNCTITSDGVVVSSGTPQSVSTPTPVRSTPQPVKTSPTPSPVVTPTPTPMPSPITRQRGISESILEILQRLGL